MIPIHEYLDRLEILDPDNLKLKDLRRAYVDKDLNSVFRLLPNEVNGEIEDLRKAVLEQNLHSIFRLIEDEDLRKLLLEDNAWKLWSTLEKLGIDSEFNEAFKRLHSNNIEYDKDCFSRGQVKSKKWLVDELKNINPHLGTVLICAGWYGLLTLMLFNSGLRLDTIRSIDIDKNCEQIADKVNLEFLKQGWKFKAVTADILDIEYTDPNLKAVRNDGSYVPIHPVPQTIINTSCEHIKEFDKWYDSIPNDTLVILQANDYEDIEEHINTYKNLQEFDNNIPMKETLYLGELDLEIYTRFMKIGFK
jgi:hypothetical protein